MTTLLDEAIARVRELPEADQDLAADVPIQIVESRNGPTLSPEQVQEVEQTREGLRTGTARLLTGGEVDAMWALTP